MTPLLRAAGLRLCFGAAPALDDVGIDVFPGELLTIVGPSGSGKTTLLRVLAGFEVPDQASELSIAGADMRGVPPHRRPLATVFQHYALFPHLTAGGNVEYGLRVRRVPKGERRAQAEAALAMLHLPGTYDRRIGTLSGGERQRVAFARALVTKPALLLLDEPMGALDERLRAVLEADIRRLQRELGMTIVQVTHSREEALSMSDRVAVMRSGRIEQVGTPADIFERPCSRFVAAFMGLNVVDGVIASLDADQVAMRSGAQIFHGPWTGVSRPQTGTRACLAVHPERLAAGVGGADDNAVQGVSGDAVYQGIFRSIVFDSSAGRLAARLSGASDAAVTGLHWPPAACAIFPDEAA